METRRCTKCAEDKLPGEFFKRSRSKSGYMSECKVCHNAWQVSNYPRRRELQRTNRLKLRAEALETLGGACCRCGVADRRVLQIDHINGGGCAEQRRIGDSGIQRKIVNGAEGYQILCANCHAIKTWHEET